MQTPVLFLIFNRPDTTEKVFEEIRKAQPKKLFVAADGPRAYKEGEVELCVQTRAIIEKIDWDCEVKTLFREENLGCKKAVSEGITWFFDNVKEGIILEDDCLPNSSFFTFCEAMLEKYRDDERIMHISGDNPLNEEPDNSYYFVKTPHIWGWATWRRAWTKYDVDMKSYPDFKIENVFKESYIQKYWLKVFKRVLDGEIDTWDYQWAYSLFYNNAFSIVPKKVLVSNLGFNENATHITNDYRFGNRPSQEMEQIIHPEKIEYDEVRAKKIFKDRFGIEPRTPIFLLKREFQRTIKKLVKS